MDFSISDLMPPVDNTEAANTNAAAIDLAAASAEQNADNIKDEKTIVPEVSDILDLIQPSTDESGSDNSSTNDNKDEVDWKALYKMKVLAGEFNEVEDEDNISWNKETYDKINQYHRSKLQSDSSKQKESKVETSENTVIKEQTQFIKQLESDVYKTRAGAEQLLKYDYITLKGLSETEYNKIIEGLSEEEILNKGEVLKDAFKTRATKLINDQKKIEADAKKAKEAEESNARAIAEEGFEKWRQQAKASAKQLNVTEEFVDHAAELYKTGKIHNLIQEYVVSNVGSAIELVDFIEKKMGTSNKNNNKIKLAELKLN